MRCAFCEEPAWYRCARTAKLVCARHARLEVVARDGDRDAGPREVRKATERDYPRLREIALHFWGETDVECFERVYDVLKLPAVVAVVEGEVAGFLSYAMGGEALVVAMLNVVPEFQGRGLGKALLCAVIDEAGEAGLSRLIVATSNDDLSALDFYQRAGFVIDEIVPEKLVEHHGGVGQGFAGIPVRDEIRLQLSLQGSAT